MFFISSDSFDSPRKVRANIPHAPTKETGPRSRRAGSLGWRDCEGRRQERGGGGPGRSPRWTHLRLRGPVAPPSPYARVPAGNNLFTCRKQPSVACVFVVPIPVQERRKLESKYFLSRAEKKKKEAHRLWATSALPCRAGELPMNRPAPRCHQGTSQDRLGGQGEAGRSLVLSACV